MRRVKLFWKSRVTKKKKALVVSAIQSTYKDARDCGPYVELKAPINCTKVLWIFMLVSAFKDIE